MGLRPAAMFPAETMRHFIRHPVDIPVEVSAGEVLVHAKRLTSNVSLGGLAIQSDRALAPGVVVELRIPLVEPMFEAKARVVWCRAYQGGHVLGVEFIDPEDRFRARMVQQVCCIHQYRKLIHETEGRRLTAEEAAVEWIAKYASGFPRSEPNGIH